MKLNVFLFLLVAGSDTFVVQNSVTFSGNRRTIRSTWERGEFVVDRPKDDEPPAPSRNKRFLSTISRMSNEKVEERHRMIDEQRLRHSAMSTVLGVAQSMSHHNKTGAANLALQTLRIMNGQNNGYEERRPERSFFDGMTDVVQNVVVLVVVTGAVVVASVGVVNVVSYTRNRCAVERSRNHDSPRQPRQPRREHSSHDDFQCFCGAPSCYDAFPFARRHQPPPPPIRHL